MNTSRWILISLTFAVAVVLIFQVYIWSEEFKHRFMYNEDYISYIMVFVFVIALTGIFKWFLHEEIILTDPKRKRRKRK
jgi:multisubunit Na+/H+ antiporter MnhB subunit